MQYIGRLDDVNRDLLHILSYLGVNKMTHLENSDETNFYINQFDNFIDYYDQECLDKVNELFSDDFACFRFLKILDIDEFKTVYKPIQDIPLNKWVHCAVRVQNVSIDIYINGVMTQRKNLQTLPLQNYYDTYVGDKNSFNGYISSLNYYAYALNYDQIQSDYVKGPNMTLYGQNNQINYKDYLAMNWYYKTI
jgi:hypothetical protein